MEVDYHFQRRFVVETLKKKKNKKTSYSRHITVSPHGKEGVFFLFLSQNPQDRIVPKASCSQLILLKEKAKSPMSHPLDRLDNLVGQGNFENKREGNGLFCSVVCSFVNSSSMENISKNDYLILSFLSYYKLIQHITNRRSIRRSRLKKVRCQCYRCYQVGRIGQDRMRVVEEEDNHDNVCCFSLLWIEQQYPNI